MKTCPNCHAPIVTEAASFRDYGCGSSWAEGEGVNYSNECIDRATRQSLAEDDEINRRRMGRHFESQHWGT